MVEDLSNYHGGMGSIDDQEERYHFFMLKEWKEDKKRWKEALYKSCALAGHCQAEMTFKFYEPHMVCLLLHPLLLQATDLAKRAENLIVMMDRLDKGPKTTRKQAAKVMIISDGRDKKTKLELSARAASFVGVLLRDAPKAKALIIETAKRFHCHRQGGVTKTNASKLGIKGASYSFRLPSSFLLLVLLLISPLFPTRYAHSSFCSRDVTTDWDHGSFVHSCASISARRNNSTGPFFRRHPWFR